MLSLLSGFILTASAAGMIDLVPARVELVVPAGESRQQEFVLHNNTDATLQIELQFEDFESGNKEAVKLLGDDHGRYSLVDYLSSDQKSFALFAGESKKVSVTVALPPNLQSGAYYGSVLFAISREPIGQVKVSSRLGALMFVRVAGVAQSSGELKEFAWSGDHFSFLFENSGDVYLNPYGYVVLKKWWGEEVWFREIEPDFVLPKTFRNFEAPIGGQLHPGLYRATIRLNRGYDNIVDELSVWRWEKPLASWRWLVALIIILWLGRQIFLKLKV